MRKTKIICTIGPSSKDEKILKSMITGGMDIARINTSHSDFKEVVRVVKDIRRISKEHKKNTAIMLDLQGQKIRIGKLGGELNLCKKQKVAFTTEADCNLDYSKIDKDQVY